MKSRLITNGILSIIILIGSTIRFTYVFFDIFDIPYNRMFAYLFNGVFTQIVLLVGSGIASLVMGIATLVMEKDEKIKGLAITSGILAILGGVLGANAIVSFIAVNKINKNEKSTKTKVKANK